MTPPDWQALLTPPESNEAQERTVLLLNSLLPAVGDGTYLVDLAVASRERHQILQSKLASLRQENSLLLADTCRSSHGLQPGSSKLSFLRHSLTDDLEELVSNLVSTCPQGEKTLFQDIDFFHRSLQDLQSIKKYVQVVEYALRLSELSLQRFQNISSTISEKSFCEYLSLHNFVSDIANANVASSSTSEEQTLSIVQFLESVREHTWAQILGGLSRTLKECAERLGWPSHIDYISSPEPLKGNFENAFCNLVTLQKIEQKIRPRFNSPEGLHYLGALIQPISLRFKYHFCLSRETNRIDKPEWYFTHILNLAHDHRPFMETVVQRLLASMDWAGNDVWSDFVHLLLSIISRKLEQTVPTLLPHAPLLAHTIYQALLFDAALLKEGFHWHNISEKEDCKHLGVSNVILGNSNWFEAWFLGERKFADDQYHEIITSLEAWQVESIEFGWSGRQIRVTNSARRVCSLFEQITDRYSPLPRFSQRCRFLHSIQLPILNQYHDLIVFSLDSLESFSSTFVRSVPGALVVGSVESEDSILQSASTKVNRGFSGIQRLCKALLSAECIQLSLHKWNEEPFFVEQWAEMNEETSLHYPALIDSPLTTILERRKMDTLAGTMFAVLIDRFTVLSSRARDLIILQVCAEIESSLKLHLNSDDADPELEPQPEPNSDIPQLLLVPITILSSHLRMLRSFLPQAILATLYRRIASRLAVHLLSRQITYRSRFTSREGKRLRDECQLWVESCDANLDGVLGGGRTRTAAPWAKLLQATNIVSSEGEIWAKILRLTFGVMSDSEWTQAATEMFGSLELDRSEVAILLRRRVDCDH